MAVLLLVLSSTWARGEGEVRVEIIEGVPDQTNWQFDLPAPSESYAEPAFGFSSIPTRYSPKGLKMDRSAPFLFRASANVTLPAGEHQILLRSRTGSRLFVDGGILLATKFPDLNADGHEEVPEAPLPLAPNIRYLPPGHFESITNFVSDGQPHIYRLEAMIGSKGRRPELGELSVSVAGGEKPFQLLASRPGVSVPLTDEGWLAYAARRRDFWKAEDAKRRRLVSASETEYWMRRHDLARKQAASLPPIVVPAGSSTISVNNEIDRFINARLEAARMRPAPLVDDWSFLDRKSTRLN